LTPAAALWSRIVAFTAVSFALALVLAPPQPDRTLPWPAAVAVGALAGVALFAAAARARPGRPAASSSALLLLARAGFFGVWATNEELVWRRFALGELLGAGAVPALAASTVGFALMHRTRPALHLTTGGVFGALYLATGVLAASVVAHWSYNVLVAAVVDRDRIAAKAPP
jgi:membrane protease YdiL (CAAX protease family)